MLTNNLFFDDLRICNISVVSGIRQCGREVDCTAGGRKDNGILFVWQGEATFFDNKGKSLAVTDSELAFLPKFKKYKMEYTAASTTFVVVNFELYDENNKDIALFDDITLLAKDDLSQRIARTMTSFELCSSSKTISAILRKKELMYRLLSMICSFDPCMRGANELHSQISHGVHLLEQTYLENLPIAEYAKASHVSVNTFRSLFQKQLGMSPLKYRNYLRIERAKELLAEGGFTVAETAYACGFENIGYFCKYYRQITGESPGDTKRKYNLK